MVDEGRYRTGLREDRALVGEMHLPRRLRRPWAMIAEKRFRAEPREDRAKIDVMCLAAGSGKDGGLL